LKELQEDGEILLVCEALGLRMLVEEESKPAVEGVRSALRFCVMLSSIEARDSRRKSFKTVVLKQNCGVSSG